MAALIPYNLNYQDAADPRWYPAIPDVQLFTLDLGPYNWHNRPRKEDMKTGLWALEPVFDALVRGVLIPLLREQDRRRRDGSDSI